MTEEGTSRGGRKAEGIALEDVDKAGVEAEFCPSEKDSVCGVRVVFCGQIAERGEKIWQDEEGGDGETKEIKDGRGEGPWETVEPFDANGVSGPEEGNRHED